MFPNGRFQWHPAKNTKVQWSSKEKDSTGESVRKSHVWSRIDRKLKKDTSIG